MDEETQSHLFEPFFTTKGPGARHRPGIGHGLWHHSPERRGHRQSANRATAPPRASTFRWPRPRPRPAEAVPEKTAAVEQLTGAETVLLVEDEARVRKLIVDILAARGYRVLEATRGNEAVRLAASHKGPIHLAVVDVVMPEMSGPDVVRQIQPAHPDMRVLYISGYTDEAMVHHGILESGPAFLQKPFLPGVLVEKSPRSPGRQAETGRGRIALRWR